MRKLTVLKISIAVFIILTLSLSWALAQGKPSKGKNEIQVSGIEMGVFVNYGYNSPPWYPPSEETNSYTWAPRIYWSADDLPVDITVYTGNEPISGTFGAIESGFTTWDSETGTSLYGSINEETTTGPGVALDSENTVGWATIDGPGGIIAVTYYWHYTSSKKMVEFDIVFDSQESWSTTGDDNAFDVQNVSAHEAGHTLVLKDLRSPKDGALTMHAYTWLGDTTKRTLGSGDILGVRAIYGE